MKICCNYYASPSQQENIREIRMTDVLSRTFVLIPIENRINTQSIPSGVYLVTAVDYLGRIVGSTKVIK